MPAADQANASQADPPGLTFSVSVSALQHLIIEVLRRPVEFTAYLTEHLLEHGDEGLAQVPIAAWVRESGLPAGAPAARSDAFSAVERQATGGNTPVAQLETGP